MSIYKDLIDAVDNGKKFKVDLINKSLWINRKQIIKEGVIVHEQSKGKNLIEPDDLHDLHCTIGLEGSLNENPWSWIELLYKEFKYSVPKENSNKRSYFKALSVDELTEAELIFNINRDLGQALLEGYILLASLNDWLKWIHGDYWFYQSKNDENLVVLRNFI